MRLLSIAVLLSAVAMPSYAQSRSEAETVRRLNNPVVQEGAATAMSALVGILLDTKVGALAPYADGKIRPSDTLGDVQRRRDPQFEARLQNQTRRAVATAGAVAGDALTMRDEVAHTADRLRGAVTLIANLAEAYSDDN